jgi:predicted amidohydrolase
MRSHPNFESLVEQIEFFVDAVSDYSSDFVLFPELFNAPLMAPYNDMGTAEAMRELAKFTDLLLDKFKSFAVSYNINIVTGSMPIINDKGSLQNVSYLCHRSGEVDEYRKIHITPNERETWGMVGGDKIRVFDTDCGKVGVVVCYDVEFPELIRLLADQGMNILFVPFLTDTQNGYMRVRNCAMARAVENECYVAIAGCVGNLPKVNNMDIQYAQSAVFTPSDFAFPTNSIKAETTPNTEMTLIVDVDLDLLKELHNHGSVRIMKDRRNDLYELKLKKE